jgi:Cof subfamily protein (haloacid dehalogenase superfamily)
MKDIKAIVFDYDDTLYSHQTEEVPQLTKEALHELKKNGYLLGLCTSRFPSELKSFPEDMKSYFDVWMEGTGCLIRKDSTYLYKEVISESITVQLIEYLEKENIIYIWITDDLEEHFSMPPTGKLLEHIIQWRHEVPTVRKWNHEPIINLSYFYANEIQTQEIHRFINNISISQWGSSGQINAKNIDKAYGLKKFASIFNLDMKEIAVFGDGENDIPMIDLAGFGIAVGSANNELMKHAAMVTDDIECGGIYNACVKQHWIANKEGIQILFFDIDGTTYQNSIRDLPQSTWDTLRKLKKNYTLVINTSRAKEEMVELPKEFLAMMDAIIMTAGAEILMNGRTTYRYLNDDHVREAIKVMDENHIVYRWVDDHNGCYLNCDDEEINARFYRLYKMIPAVKKWNGERLIHILYYTNDEALIQKIDEIFADETHTHFGYGHEQTPHGIEKSTAMKLVCENYGLTLENAAAFGDGANDAAMIQAAKIGVAMGNACEACKNVADYVTDTIENDGLYKACLQFGWIEK